MTSSLHGGLVQVQGLTGWQPSTGAPTHHGIFHPVHVKSNLKLSTIKPIPVAPRKEAFIVM